MSIKLKLVNEEIEEKTVQALRFVKNNDEKNEVKLEIANREGFTLDEVTFERLKTLIILGQRYEEISESQKSEFIDL